MIGGFEICMPLLLDIEKGYWNDPQGGPTNLGVTLAAWQAWKKAPATAADIQALTPDKVGDFYRAEYWAPVRGDDLPAGVDWMTFDSSVNQGPGRAARWLQLAAGVNPDGIIGPLSMAAIQRVGADDLLSRLYSRRWLAYRQAPGFDEFGDGWLSRLDKVLAQAEAMAAGHAVTV